MFSSWLSGCVLRSLRGIAARELDVGRRRDGGADEHLGVRLDFRYGVVLDPVERHRVADEVKAVLVEVEQDRVADHVAVVVDRDVLLGLPRLERRKRVDRVGPRPAVSPARGSPGS
jgi:hypothetical protein